MSTVAAASAPSSAVWAHPDDETYLSGGLLAELTDAGQRVVCVTATRGEAADPQRRTGGAGRPGRDPHARSSRPRWRSSASPSTTGSTSPTAAAPRSTPSGRSPGWRALLDDVRPDTVLTFGPDGFTGHPDHRAVSAWTDLAVRRSAAAPRVLHAVAREKPVDPELDEDYGVFDLGRPRICADDEIALAAASTAPDVLDRKVEALLRQVSQTAGLVAAVGVERFRAWVATECFAASRKPDDARAPARAQCRTTTPSQEPPMSLDRTSLALCVDVLGPLVLRVDGEAVDVPGVRRRALLALLALEAGRGVERRPARRRTVARGAAGERRPGAVQPRLPAARPPRPAREPPGAARRRLPPAPGARRAGRRRGSSARAHGLAGPSTPPAIAAELARSALELWRGPALAEFRGLPALEMESVGLDELRLQLVDDLVEARLALGDRTVVVDAAAAAAASPLRERTALLHVRALADRRPHRRRDGRRPGASGAGSPTRPASTRGPPWPSSSSASPPAPIAPPLPAAGLAPRRVARPDSPMVGREHDREEIVRLLGRNAIVTLTGTGGVGQDPARPRRRGRARWRAGQPRRSSSTWQPWTGRSGSARPSRRRSACAPPERSRPADVADALAGRDLLLLLDNCEHLLDACRDLVVTLRRLAPTVRVLATSRTPCTCRGSTSSGSSRCPCRGTPPTSTPCGGSRPYGRSSTTPGAGGPTTSWPPPTPTTWSRCCAAWTGCRSGSSSPPARWR